MRPKRLFLLPNWIMKLYFYLCLVMNGHSHSHYRWNSNFCQSLVILQKHTNGWPCCFFYLSFLYCLYQWLTNWFQVRDKLEWISYEMLDTFPVHQIIIITVEAPSIEQWYLLKTNKGEYHCIICIGILCFWKMRCTKNRRFEKESQMIHFKLHN